jgi:spermidine synthase
MPDRKSSTYQNSWVLPILLAIFFISGFCALLYQVAWQRMLGLFSGSDVRSVTIIVASYLAGLGIGSLLGGILSDRLSDRQSIQIYGFCNLGIAVFAICSRFLFYDILFLKLRYLARSPVSTLLIAFISLLIPTILMGLSLPLLSKAIAGGSKEIASRIGWLYGVNTLGSGLGSLVSGWYLIGTLGYDGTVYFGAILNVIVGIVALSNAHPFDRNRNFQNLNVTTKVRSVREWCILVFLSGFAAISLEIIWFRVLDVALQSNAYTYAHLLAFILVSNALGSLLGAKFVRYISKPKQVFLAIQGIVIAYSAIAIWLISLYWRSHPQLRDDIGYIDPNNINTAIAFKYLVLPLVLVGLPNLLLGFYFPLVQKAVQKSDRQVGRRVGAILVANILGNTTGSLLTGLVLLDRLGTSTSLRLLCLLGLGFILAIRPNKTKAKILAIVAIATIVFFPNNTRLWASLHGILPQQYFIVAEDSTGVAAIGETNKRGVLYASGQAEANFPYMHVHALLGTIPALSHVNPASIMIIGLGSGGTPHTIGVNPLTQHVRAIEILGAELPVLREYAKTTVGKPLNYLLQDPRYEISVGDGRRELVLSDRQFDIIEADAIQPWRSRAGMLYSQEFFAEVRSRLAPGGIFVEWNVGPEVVQTFRNVFPYVTQLDMSEGLSVLIGCDRVFDFDRKHLLTELELPAVLDFLANAGIDVKPIRTDVKAARVSMYSHAKDGKPEAVNTDLFPRSEYYLNRVSDKG